MQKLLTRLLLAGVLTPLLSCFSHAQPLLVKDIQPGPGSSMQGTYQELVRFNGPLIFPADDGTNGLELWRSNGTAGGTQLLLNINANPGQGSNPTELSVLGSKLFFVADDGGPTGRELRVWDGSTLHTLETEPGPASPVTVNSVIQAGSDFYFLSETPTHGGELWKWNGVMGNPPVVLEAVPGATGTQPVWLSYGNNHIWGTYHELAYDAVNNRLYWFGIDNAPSYFLWRYDIGSAAPVNAGALLSFNPHIQPPVAFNGYVYFLSMNASYQNIEPYRYDGTSISMFQDIVPGNGSSQPYHFTLHNNKLYFLAINPANSTYLSSIGRLDASHTFSFIPGLPASFYTQGFVDDNPLRIVGNNLLAQSGTKIYRITNAGNATQVLTNFTGASINESGLVRVAATGKYFYSKYENNDQPQLYKDDGSGPVQVSTFDGECHCPLHPFVYRNGQLYFAATTAAKGWELWKIDPFTASPQPVSRDEAADTDTEASAEPGETAPDELPCSVYPNPATDIFYLALDEPAAEPLAFVLRDSRGQTVSHGALEPGETETGFPVSNLHPGVYVLSVTGILSGSSAEKRVVVQR